MDGKVVMGGREGVDRRWRSRGEGGRLYLYTRKLIKIKSIREITERGRKMVDFLVEMPSKR